MIVGTAALRKVYGTTTALDGVDVAVPEGAVYGLVGPNGAGKTTLLGILAGLRRPTSGEVRIGVERKKIAILPDTPQFDPWLTALEVVDLARALVAPELPAARAMDALRLAGLADDAQRRVGGFSRGMLQRLGLAATVVGEPSVLLLDEPCAALDPAGRREVLDLVANLAGRATVVLSTHLLGDVQEVCDHVGVLRSGKLLFQGRLEALLVGKASPSFAVRLHPPIEAVETRLKAEPWVTRVERVGAEEIVVGARTAEEAETNLVRVLADAGARVARIEPRAQDLESIFLELTA